MNFRPGDVVTITTDEGPLSTTITRTVHSLYLAQHDLEADGINTTQGDFFAFDEYDIKAATL